MVADAEWDRLQDLGFDLVYLMGVWLRSAEGRRLSKALPHLHRDYEAVLPGWTMADVVGSPFAVQEYRPDPRIGSWEELDAVRHKLRRRGMGLILDLVPNHTGLDHPWVRAHPEYYVQGGAADVRRRPEEFCVIEAAGGHTHFIARGRDPYFAPWPDTAQLNYFNPALRQEMLDVVRLLAGHCDGIRCDMSMLLLNEIFRRTWSGLLEGWPEPGDEFWPAAVAAAPGLLLLAEVYWDMEWRMLELGFHYTYDKRLYDRLRQAPAAEVRHHLSAPLEYQQRMARFLENHDEPRAAAVFPPARQRGAAVAMATLPGLRFFHHGQFEGRTLRPPVQLARVTPEPVNEALRAFYLRLIEVSRHPAFHDGLWSLLEVRPAGDSSAEDLLAWQAALGADRKLVVVNLGESLAQGHVALPVNDDSAGTLTFHDELNGGSYDWEAGVLRRQGLYVRLGPGEAHVFSVAGARRFAARGGSDGA